MTAQFSLPQIELVRRASTRTKADVKTILKPTNLQYSSFVATATDPRLNQESDSLLSIAEGNCDRETLPEPTPSSTTSTIIDEVVKQTWFTVLCLGYLFSVCWFTLLNPILSSKMALYLIGIFEVVMVTCIYYTWPSKQTITPEENNESETEITKPMISI